MLRTGFLLACAVNRVTLVGVVRDVQSGFVSETPCLQFTLVTQDFDIPQSRVANSSEESLPIARRTSGCTKQQFAVRCTSANEEEINKLRLRLEEGTLIKCVGQLRINMQIDSGRRRSFPYVSVPLTDNTKGVLVLSAKRSRSVIEGY